MKNLGILVLFCLFLMACQSEAQERVDKSTQNKQTEKSEFSVQKTEKEWKKQLTPEQYHVLREAGTEPRYSSPVLDITEQGDLVCAACGNPVFHIKHKFDGHCGWPSFDRAIKGAVIYADDYKLGYKRIEVLCAKCGSHLGHVFQDGPRETTGERYCIDGVALKFIPKEKKQN